MKTTYEFLLKLLTALLYLILSGIESHAQIGINTTSPDPSSILDIESFDKGLLIPRVSIADLNSISPITGGSSEGLLVFNTNATTGKGFLFWTGSAWQSISGGWKTSGNSETDDSCNFIGTTNNNDLVFKTNDTESMRLLSTTQQLVIGTTNVVQENDLLRVLGDIEIGGGDPNHDSLSENLQITAQSQAWNINVKNSSVSANSNFYIGPGENSNNAAIMLSPDVKVRIGQSYDINPLSDLHVVKDQTNRATSIRIDNTASSTDIPHTSFELWDGNTDLKGFFRHNNKNNILDIGHDQGNGTFNFYAGNGTTSSNPSSIAMTLDSAGDVNIVNNLNISGDLAVTGTISKGGGTFKIDHPLDPKNKYLYHSFVESPDMMNIYNGNVTTNALGEAMVLMPEYFSALNIDFRYQLTAIGSFSKVMIAKEISGNTFLIKSEEPNVKVSWQVTGVRNDPYARKNPVIVEVEKEVHQKGDYLYPDAYSEDLEN